MSASFYVMTLLFLHRNIAFVLPRHSNLYTTILPFPLYSITIFPPQNTAIGGIASVAQNAENAQSGLQNVHFSSPIFCRLWKTYYFCTK